MRITLITLITASIFFLIACGNNSENTSTSTDTSTSANNSTPTAQTTMPEDTATLTNGLLKPMNDMMTKMHSMQMTGDFDIDFANMMIEHHQSALDMAQVELSQGKNEKMKSKAQEIITKQQKEQQELSAILQSYKESGMKHGEGDLQKSMQAMMDKMKSMQMSGNVDKDFATMMISHHEDGISMASLEVKNGMSGKLKKMAQKEITDQQKDINDFKDWLKDNTK
ncbi:MAG: DUF305 domain-containing protein [Ferruginibacter sp.]